MNFRLVSCDDASFDAYIALCRSCFPSARHFTRSYFQWLYLDNPDGKVVGFDAYDGTKLAAHYVCVPATTIVEGRRVKSLLSLNTATHPDYQGKGLFTKLAAMTYEHAAETGHELVYGVANANSTPGFVRKLGFQLVAPLEARIGFGQLGIEDWSRTVEQSCFRRAWNQSSLQWRLANPANQSSAFRLKEGILGVHAATGRWGIRAYGEVPVEGPTITDTARAILAPRLFLGIIPQGFPRKGRYFSIPEALKPSPLNLIYLNLQGNKRELDATNILLSYLDFDAY